MVDKADGMTMMRNITPSGLRSSHRTGRDAGAAGFATPIAVGARHPRLACGVRAAGVDPRGAGGDSQKGRSERRQRATPYEVKVRPPGDGGASWTTHHAAGTNIATPSSRPRGAAT